MRRAAGRKMGAPVVSPPAASAPRGLSAAPMAAGTAKRLDIRVGDKVQQRIFGNAS